MYTVYTTPKSKRMEGSFGKSINKALSVVEASWLTFNVKVAVSTLQNKGMQDMKTFLKSKQGNKTFQIKTSSTYYKLSIIKTEQKKTEVVFELNLKRATIKMFFAATFTLLGGSGATALFL